MAEPQAQKEMLELALARTRADLAESLSQLKRVVKQEFEWRVWVARNPFATLGLAFGLGFWLGSRGRQRYDD
jgi:hypothetical protein